MVVFQPTMSILLTLLLALSIFHHIHSFSVPSPFSGITAKSLRTGQPTDLSTFLTTPNEKKSTPSSSSSSSSKDYTFLVLGTYAADFNAIEYAQRLRYYIPALRKRGVTKFGMVLNAEEDAARAMAEMVDLDIENDVELFVDPKGEAGRAFGVERGWRPDDEGMSPFVKLFGMLFGLGAWATLPSVIGGYIGNPSTPQPWIEDALAVGQKKGRWPNSVVEIDSTTGNVKHNKFAELPWVGSWQRRPLELATLRLQNMIDISIKNWKELAPTDKALEAGVLTQLGGCIVVDSNSESGDTVFKWRDQGICSVANFETILKKLPVQEGRIGEETEGVEKMEAVEGKERVMA